MIHVSKQRFCDALMTTFGLHASIKHLPNGGRFDSFLDAKEEIVAQRFRFSARFDWVYLLPTRGVAKRA